ncbi:hypothetical protein [Flavilitoribacter nigricans]|uniref:Uncharacterized protein n=1 Tax=Flavilitoribacter nigricans (strain ATCC 23147 / DSM 23189 / NBRC 102662 / NCIMB 1420 / SS-2) TaxID=1122177 RepID=A0A2D0N9E0_FLAN2|nr:hypothetical protein [Flavilitoribacter nigricans]PHN05097.1 hypothetical protein CRP01_18930 [Flavilitoribacter nigricans DSM 23189 = NBRC 102662]
MDTDQELLEGFNAGYLIEKHRPALSKQLVAAVEGVELPFVEGFLAGTQEYAKERTQSKTIAKLKEASKGIPRPIRNKDRDDKDRGFEIDV